MESSERRAMSLLRAQYGVVAVGQLRQAGLTRGQMATFREAGEWVAVHRGVYRHVAFPEKFEQRLMAGLLAAGAGSLASHGAASWLWGLQRHPPPRPSLTVPAQRHPLVEGVDIHRLNDLDHLRVSHRHNFECTGPLRTLVDLAAVAPRQDLAGAVDTALSSGLVTVQGIEAELERRAAQGRRGVRQLRGLLASRGMTGAPTPSALEAEALALLARWKIQVSGREVHAGPGGRYRLDISLTPPVALEVDGFAYHWSPEAMAYDDQRRNRLRLQGTFLLVYVWQDIRFDALRVGREVLAALALYSGRAAAPFPNVERGVRTGSSMTRPPAIL